MKTKILFTIFLMVGAISVFSQPITITEADMPHVGTTVIYMEYNDQEIDPGTSGANVTWDFSSLSSYTGSSDTVSYVNPAGSPYAGYFSDANVLSFQNVGYSYNKIDQSVYAYLGGFGYLYQQWRGYFYNPPITLLTLPADYQATFTGSSSYYSTAIKDPMPCDSIKFTGTMTVESEIDGWGTIITPWGTYACLRQRSYICYSDSEYCLDSTGTWNYTGMSSPCFWEYQWWTNDLEFSVLSITKQLIYTGTVTLQIRCIINSTAAIDDYAAENSLKVVPNPSTNEINFFVNSTNPSKLVIYDGMGKMITSISILIGKASINGSELTKGLFYYNVLSEKGEIERKGKFIVE